MPRPFSKSQAICGSHSKLYRRRENGGGDTRNSRYKKGKSVLSHGKWCCRSHNHYPVGDIKSSDGLAAIAFGLGRTVAEGENVFEFRLPTLIVFTNFQMLLLHSTQAKENFGLFN